VEHRREEVRVTGPAITFDTVILVPFRSSRVFTGALVLSAALYCVASVGENTTLISGCSFMKAGRMVSCQIGKSSERQLSIVSVTCSPSSGSVVQEIKQRGLNDIGTGL
jgi:hypothetical protein